MALVAIIIPQATRIIMALVAIIIPQATRIIMALVAIIIPDTTGIIMASGQYNYAHNSNYNGFIKVSTL
jgi:hypothetical protein